MNNTDSKYARYALVKEMLETSSVVEGFSHGATASLASELRNKKSLFLTGEGSSRIFPAKRAIYDVLKHGGPVAILTEGATQALEYTLNEFAVIGASNSGKTKELVRLFLKLKKQGHDAFFGLTATPESTIGELALNTHVMHCGKENAVAATKSVVEQALFYDSILRHLEGRDLEGTTQLAADIREALTLTIDPEIVSTLKNADKIYFAGRNNGVAEELTLKTNEITRKKSDFLEGTYAVHGIEEVMDKNEVVIIVDPFASEEQKFSECLIGGVGMKVIAIADRQTSFPTIQIPEGGAFREYVQLAAGWNLLVETGIALGIDLDKPVRARKVGNEYIL